MTRVTRSKSKKAATKEVPLEPLKSTKPKGKRTALRDIANEESNQATTTATKKQVKKRKKAKTVAVDRPVERDSDDDDSSYYQGSRFSLPSVDDSFTEATRDWRTSGAIDY